MSSGWNSRGTSQSPRLLGYPPRVHGTMDALRKIVAQAGVLGLWRGCLPNVQVCPSHWCPVT